MATQSERKAQTRQLLLDAAADLFAHKGFHAVSIDAVAEAANRTSGAVYSHFGGRDGLLRALLEHWAGLTTSELTSQVSGAPMVDRLALIWRGLFTGPEDRAAAWMLLEHELWLYSARNPENADALARRYGAARTGIASALEDWAADGELVPPGDAADTAAMVLALLLGLEMQHRLDPAAIPDRIAIDGLARLMGVQLEPAAQPSSSLHAAANDERR